MQKTKLDLYHLLAKYEGIATNTSGNPLRDRGTPPINREQYRSQQGFHRNRNLTRSSYEPAVHDQLFASTYQLSSQTIQSNFSMSKSEVEAYLHSLKEEIRTEERELGRCEESAFRTISDSFQKRVEMIKRDLLQVLNRTFQDTEMSIREELATQTKTQTEQLSIVYQKIAAFNKEIDRMSTEIRGSEYRKVIAEVVTRDFNKEFTQLKSASSIARASYFHSLGEVEVDRSKLGVIKQQMQRLLFVARKQPKSMNLSVRDQIVIEIADPPIPKSANSFCGC